MQIVAPPQVSSGTIKSFGLIGEQYEVVKALRPLDDGDWIYEIKLVKTGEMAEYRLTHINDDPVAH